MAPVGQRVEQPSPDDVRQGRINNISQDLTDFLNGNRIALNNLVDLHTTVFDRIEELESRVEAQNLLIGKKDLVHDAMAERIRVLERQVQLLEFDITMLNGYMAQNEDATKSLFLKLEGVGEENNNSLLAHTVEILSRTGVTCTDEEIDYVRRIGKYRDGKTRPVLVCFRRQGIRNQIFYNRNNLNRERRSHVWINDEVSDGTRRMRKATRDIATLAKASGYKNVKIHTDGILINNSKFRHSELDRLPPDISPSKAKSRIDGQDLFFQSEVSPLSNFFPSIIVEDDDTIYVNAEQAYQHKKAVFHNKPFEATRIYNTRNPYEIKKTANSLPTSREWKEREVEIMTSILRKKFTQNEMARRFLSDTEGLHLHEASTDLTWATGADLSSKSLLSGDWRGKDKLGQLLEQTRGMLKSMYTDQDHPQSTDSKNDVSGSAADDRGSGLDVATDQLLLDGGGGLAKTNKFDSDYTGVKPLSATSTYSHRPDPSTLIDKETVLSHASPGSNHSQSGDTVPIIDHPTPNRSYGLDLSNAALQLAGASDMITERGHRSSQRPLSSSPYHTPTHTGSGSRSSGYKLRKARGVVL